MNKNNLLENYQYYSGKASDIVRQLGFAGIAVIWIFKYTNNGKQIVPSELIPAAILIVLSLSFDFLHYVIGSLILGLYHRIKEYQNTKEDDDFIAPRIINWPTIFFFWGKILLISKAYYLILNYLMQQVIN